MKLINQDYRIYTNTLPKDSMPIGVIDTNGLGALVLLLKTGLYVKVNAGCITNLNQRCVKNLLNTNNVH